MGALKGGEGILAVEEVLSSGIVVFFKTLMSDCLEDPDSAESKRTMVRAFALAIREIAEEGPDAQALIDHMKANL